MGPKEFFRIAKLKQALRKTRRHTVVHVFNSFPTKLLFLASMMFPRMPRNVINQFVLHHWIPHTSQIHDHIILK